ncbi:MAG: hypothetical protein R3C18_11430 [Planctomycetaceae bacterium]
MIVNEKTLGQDNGGQSFMWSAGPTFVWGDEISQIPALKKVPVCGIIGVDKVLSAESDSLKRPAMCGQIEWMLSLAFLEQSREPSRLRRSRPVASERYAA